MDTEKSLIYNGVHQDSGIFSDKNSAVDCPVHGVQFTGNPDRLVKPYVDFAIYKCPTRNKNKI